MADRIYLDYAATTPTLPSARQAMIEALGRWANPSSPHADGRAARSALEEARRRVAGALGWDGSVVFTSGATEAFGLALRGARDPIVSSVEHDAVLRHAPVRVEAPVKTGGLVDLEALAECLRGRERPLVVVQHANPETGIVQPIGAVEELVARQNGTLIVDAAQSAGKLDLPSADMVIVSAHKLGGPPGAGALLVRDRAKLVAIGGQEQGYRPGTENVPAILGFAAAVEAEPGWMAEAHMLRTLLEERLMTAGAEIVGEASPRVATIGAYRMPGVPSAAQLIHFDALGISVSAGSACSSGSLKPSHVLAAIGWPEANAREVIRVSFGRCTTRAEVERFADAWTALSQRRRAA